MILTLSLSLYALVKGVALKDRRRWRWGNDVAF
jgi:hypothetical protein